MAKKKTARYAVVETGGRQERVSEGDVLRVDRRETARGQTVEAGRVLLVAGAGEVRIGRPEVPGARVLAEVLGETKGKKLRVFKMKRRKGSQRMLGHRQQYTRLRITGIEMKKETESTPKKPRKKKST